MILTNDQNAEIWRIAILLMQADGQESLTLDEFKKYIELVDVDDVKKRFPAKCDREDEYYYKVHAVKISRMKKIWDVLDGLTYKEIGAHELFKYCNTSGGLSPATLGNPESLAYALSLTKEQSE